jgi:hypothetical protein
VNGNFKMSSTKGLSEVCYHLPKLGVFEVLVSIEKATMGLFKVELSCQK